MIALYLLKVKVGDFDTLQFSPIASSFDSPTKEPSNTCYCLDPDGSCQLPSGLLDISGCQPEGATWNSPKGTTNQERVSLFCIIVTLAVLYRQPNLHVMAPLLACQPLIAGRS